MRLDNLVLKIFGKAISYTSIGIGTWSGVAAMYELAWGNPIAAGVLGGLSSMGFIYGYATDKIVGDGLISLYEPEKSIGKVHPKVEKLCKEIERNKRRTDGILREMDESTKRFERILAARELLSGMDIDYKQKPKWHYDVKNVLGCKSKTLEEQSLSPFYT